MEWIKKLAEQHETWIHYARKIGAGSDAEDLVQDAYIKLMNSKALNEKKCPTVSNVYMFRTMHNLFGDKLRKGSIPTVELLPYQEHEEPTNIPDKKALELIHTKVNEEVKKWDWYDRMLFNYYRYSEKSIRQIHEETGISTASITKDLKECKARIKESVGEDYMDYKNGEFELINK